ncbi:hypothetical protein EMIT0P12_50429 [Pseudomonas sp. IT-P12]
MTYASHRPGQLRTGKPNSLIFNELIPKKSDNCRFWNKAVSLSGMQLARKGCVRSLTGVGCHTYLLASGFLNQDLSMREACQ